MFIVYIPDRDNNYETIDVFDTEEEARDAALRWTGNLDYPEILAIRKFENDIDSFITLYAFGKEWMPI